MPKLYTSIELAAIARILDLDTYAYDPDKRVFVQPVNVIIPSDDDISAMVAVLSTEQGKADALVLVETTLNNLTQKVKDVIADGRVSPSQQERYGVKQRAALADNVALFETEAVIRGTDAATLLASSALTAEAWELAYDAALFNIDALRVKLHMEIAVGDYGYVDMACVMILDNVTPVLTNTVLEFLDAVRTRLDTVEGVTTETSTVTNTPVPEYDLPDEITPDIITEAGTDDEGNITLVTLEIT